MALPSFSRNYGRSGAYENPVTVVDTKTAEIWANTITNLGNQAAARLAEQQKAEAARIKNLQDKIAFGYKQRKENTKVVYDALGVNGLNNPYLTDFASNKIDSLTQLDLDMYKQADPKALGEYNKKYDKEFQSIQNMKMTIGAMKESDAYFQEMMVDDTQVLSVGRAGGIAAYDSKDEQWLLGHMVRAGLGDGAVERFYDDEDGVMMVEYKGGIAGEGFTAVAADFFNYIPGTVPDDSKDLQKRFKDKNLLTENGTINPAYRVKENNEDVLKSSIDPATQSLIVYSPLNTDQIKGVATITTEQLAANRLLTNDAQNSYTQNIRPFLVGKNISYKDGQQWPEELTFGNGTSGKSFYDNESQKLYRQALATYAENLFGLNKTNQEVSKTKLTDSEYKRRMGIVDEDKEKETVDISYIKDLKIPIQEGPPLESGQRPVDLDALEEQLNKEGFRVVKSEEVGPRGVNKITITKSIAGADNQAVISEEMTPQDIKRNLELVETGKMPVKVEDEDFSLYKINQ